MRDQNPIIGYIVTTGYPYYFTLELGKYDDSPSVLVQGDSATLFTRRPAAKRAIKRSKKYSEANNFNWGCDKYKIVRVRSNG